MKHYRFTKHRVPSSVTVSVIIHEHHSSKMKCSSFH